MGWDFSEKTADLCEKYMGGTPERRRLFYQEQLKIIDAESAELVPFTILPAQEKVDTQLIEDKRIFVLKARKLGISTLAAAHFFYDFLFTPNFQVQILAQAEEAALYLKGIYDRFYDNLDPALQFPTKKSNAHILELETGSAIRTKTATGKGLRSSTVQALHCSEFAFWSDIKVALASAGQIASANAKIIMETTANGLNDAYTLWTGNNGYKKTFISWYEDPRCVSVEKPEEIPIELNDAAKRYNLTKHQVWWAAHTYLTRCGADWNIFQQEYPTSPEVAFISKDTRYFSSVIFPHAKAKEGYICYEAPAKYRSYVMGIDSASGQPNGDYSAFVVLDVTDRQKPKIVSSMYARMRISEFAEKCLKELKKYKALAVPEVNNMGMFIVDYLTDQKYSRIYSRTKYDKRLKTYSQNLGFHTNQQTRMLMLGRIQEYVSRGWFRINDERLKDEVNTFVFNSNGKPVADVGCHDDMIMATALAFVGMNQAHVVEEEIIRNNKPASKREILEFEKNTGMLYNTVKDKLWPNESKLSKQTSSPMTSLLKGGAHRGRN